MGVTKREELEDRIEAKRKRLEARLAEAKAEGRKQTREAIESLERELTELKELIAGGWEQLTDEIAARLNEWLARGEEKQKPD